MMKGVTLIVELVYIFIRVGQSVFPSSHNSGIANNYTDKKHDLLELKEYVCVFLHALDEAIYTLMQETL